MKKGLFITLEGIEAAGKSTLGIKTISACLNHYKIKFVLTREPGGTEIAEKIRSIILEHHIENMCSDTELLLYFAARAQHLNCIIKPNLEKGIWVICDRFTDATYAYQGGGRGISDNKISILEDWVQNGIKPNYTLLFDLEINTSLSRISKMKNSDRIEKEKYSFFEKVRNYYIRLANNEKNRFFVIDANKSYQNVQNQILVFLKKIINSNIY